MALSLNQAAKECGRAKSTILKAIRSGQMSAPKNDKGRYEIDPAELFRVFGTTGNTEPASTNALNRSTEVLEAKLRAQETLISRMEKEVDDLKDQRDQWQRQAERQTLLLERKTGDLNRSGFRWWPFGRH